MMGLERLLSALQQVEGPKTMLLFSAELPVGAPRVARAADAARTRIYVMHSQNATTDAGDTSPRLRALAEWRREVEGLEFLADQTGGSLFRLSGPSIGVADRITSEIAGGYLLLVDTAPDDRDGSVHRIRVRVPGRDLTVRARRQFVADTMHTTRTSLTGASPESPGEMFAQSKAPGAPPHETDISAPAPSVPAAPASAIPEPEAATATTPNHNVLVVVDRLHPGRGSVETESVVRQLNAALARRGFSIVESPSGATIVVEVTGHRLVDQGRQSPRGLNRGIIRATVPSADRIAEIRGVYRQGADVLKSAADEMARLIQGWSRQGPPPAPVLQQIAPLRPAPAIDPQTLLPRLRAWVAEYEQRLAGLVAEERYVQQYSRRVFPYPAPLSLQRRELRSETGYAWFPSPGTWFGFRDVLEVDGRPVRDRQDRLEELFIRRRFPSTEQFDRVTAASARFNIGPVRRALNVPTVALIVASPVNRGRAAFELRGYDAIDGIRVAVVAFVETSSPTFFTREGRDWPSRGLIWIEAETGRVRRTDLHLTGEELELRLTTWFTFDERLDLMVPRRMRELYDSPQRDEDYIEGTADYSNFRTFRVVTSGGDGR